MKILFEEETGKYIYNLYEEGVFPKKYGISVKNEGEETRIDDITSIYQKALDIYEALVRNTVSPVHIKYVISDIIS